MALHGRAFVPTHQLQAKADSSENATWPFISIPSVPQQKREATSNVFRSVNAHDDPYGLINCLKSVNRISPDHSDYEASEGLMVHPFPEAHSQDPNWSLPACNPIQSPKAQADQWLQHFQSENKMEHNSNFPAKSPAYGQSMDRVVGEFMKQGNGLAINHQQLFNLLNGDRDCLTGLGHKLPPGLPVLKEANTYVLQTQQSRCGKSPAPKDFSDVFTCQSSSFNSFYKERAELSRNEQCSPQGINWQVNSYQPSKSGELQSMQNQTNGNFPDVIIGERWATISPTVSAKTSATVMSQKQLVGENRMIQRGRNGAVGKQIFKLDTFQDRPPEVCKQPKTFSAFVNPPNQYQNKMSIPQGQIKPQIKRVSSVAQVPAHVGGLAMARHLHNTHMNGDVKEVGVSHSPHLDLQKVETCIRENGMVSAAKTQQGMPLMYPVRNLEGSSNGSTNFNSRSRLHHRSGGPHMDVRNRLSANESAGSNNTIMGMMTGRGENTNHGAPSVMELFLMNMAEPVKQLPTFIHEGFEQWRCLEKERKRTEVILTKTFVGKRMEASPTPPQPRSPLNPEKVDHLLEKQMREQLKVASLLNWMECLRSNPLPVNIGTALNKHRMVICFTQSRREKEQQQRPYVTEGRDILMIIALKDLVTSTRKLRTALWCAIQMTLPAPDKRPISPDNKEAACSNGYTSPSEGYSFQ